MKRYTLNHTHDEFGCAEMKEDSDGEFVAFEDYDKLREALKVSRRQISSMRCNFKESQLAYIEAGQALEVINKALVVEPAAESAQSAKCILCGSIAHSSEQCPKYMPGQYSSAQPSLI